MKKRILIVSSSLNMGGAQKMISNITMTLPDDYEADILINSDQNIQFPYKGNIISLDIPEPKNRRSLFYQGRVFLKRLKYMSELKKRNHYKACISLLDSANVANILTGKKYCRVIITSVKYMSWESKTPVYKYIVFPCIRLFYNHATCIVAQNIAIRDDLIANFGVRKDLFKVIYNGIDSGSIEELAALPLQPEEDYFMKDKTIITAGRMSYAKGQWHLVRAFTEVLKKVPDARLVIFGIGELREYLERLVKDYHIEDSVIIRGFNNELDKYISKSAVFAFPSMLEGMPTVLLEALACATAVVVTDFRSGAREIMDYPMEGEIKENTLTEYGVITPLCSGVMHEADVALEQNESFLAEALVEMLQNETLRKYYEKRGKERSEYFDMKNLMKEWLDIING
ncbi:MAG: glycosyltransferase [Lachnospiraceae bacterium]|nr:glycosyltransferase [Lachnospiraceae bacterium]